MPRTRTKNRRRYRRRTRNVKTTDKQDGEIMMTGKVNMRPVIYRGIGIPPAFYTKLKFNYNQQFTGSPITDFIIRANGPFDPLFAIGGLQPMYYDEFAALYNRYCVLASEIQVSFVNGTSAGQAAYQKVCVYPIADSFGAANITVATERDNCKYAICGPSNGDQGVMNIRHYAKTTAVVGKAHSEAQDDVLSASVISLPSREWYWHVVAGTLDGITGQNIFMDITITYYIKFYDREDVGQS